MSKKVTSISQFHNSEKMALAVIALTFLLGCCRAFDFPRQGSSFGGPLDKGPFSNGDDNSAAAAAATAQGASGCELAQLDAMLYSGRRFVKNEPYIRGFRDSRVFRIYAGGRHAPGDVYPIADIYRGSPAPASVTAALRLNDGSEFLFDASGQYFKYRSTNVAQVLDSPTFPRRVSDDFGGLPAGAAVDAVVQVHPDMFVFFVGESLHELCIEYRGIFFYTPDFVTFKNVLKCGDFA